MSNNPLIVWAAEVFGFSLGSKLLAVAMAGVCAIMLFAVRRSGSLLAGFSICAILSLFWSYSRHYDLLLLGIPLVELLTLWRARQSKLAGAAFLFLGMMLWCPISIGMWKWPIVQLLFGAACLLATATIIVLESRIQAAELNHALRSQISKDRTVSYTAAFSSEVS
jgi:hypothetical protein